MKDHEGRIVRRNQLLNDALQAWDFDIVDSDVSEIGTFKNNQFYVIF